MTNYKPRARDGRYQTKMSKPEKRHKGRPHKGGVLLTLHNCILPMDILETMREQLAQEHGRDVRMMVQRKTVQFVAERSE
jgi:hypothetical protein